MLTPAAITAADASEQVQRALRVTVTNGDLSFVAEPLLLGHYRATRLTGTEAVMNHLLRDVMEASLDKGLYPDAPGTHQVFVNTLQPIRNDLTSRRALKP